MPRTVMAALHFTEPYSVAMPRSSMYCSPTTGIGVCTHVCMCVNMQVCICMHVKYGCLFQSAKIEWPVSTLQVITHTLCADVHVVHIICMMLYVVIGK